jgi:hypothetical protein
LQVLCNVLTLPARNPAFVALDPQAALNVLACSTDVADRRNER